MKTIHELGNMKSRVHFDFKFVNGTEVVLSASDNLESNPHYLKIIMQMKHRRRFFFLTIHRRRLKLVSSEDCRWC